MRSKLLPFALGFLLLEALPAGAQVASGVLCVTGAEMG